MKAQMILRLKRIRTHLLPHALIISLFSSSVASEARSSISYLCSLDGDTRVIAVEYSTTEPTPCAVTYLKNNEKQTLWQASDSHGYCEQQAQAFLEKQRSWGWNCQSENIVAAE